VVWGRKRDKGGRVSRTRSASPSRWQLEVPGGEMGEGRICTIKKTSVSVMSGGSMGKPTSITSGSIRIPESENAWEKPTQTEKAKREKSLAARKQSFTLFGSPTKRSWEKLVWEKKGSKKNEEKKRTSRKDFQGRKKKERDETEVDAFKVSPVIENWETTNAREKGGELRRRRRAR